MNSSDLSHNARIIVVQKLYSYYINKDSYIDSFVESFEKIEDLNANTNNPSYYLNYKQINKFGFRSVLSGDGGDEVFIGYDWYYLNRYR